MSNRNDTADWDLKRVRQTTRSLVEAIMFDEWPSLAAQVDFGLKSQEHYEALYYPLRNEEITPTQLDGALCHGPKITELANAAPSNPHKGLVFVTDWDLLREHGMDAGFEVMELDDPRVQALCRDRDNDRER
ncbi:MAG: hypothetical protein K2X87_27055 [Gemmataceae bacterium]|nr:hypothetical protein [Gemmataceae bacterium]